MEHITKPARLKAGDFILGGGVYLPNKKQAETVAALKALIAGDITKLQYVWEGHCLEFVADQVNPLVAGSTRYFQWAGILQKVGSRLVYLPNDGWWPVPTVEALIRRVEGNKRRVQVGGAV